MWQMRQVGTEGTRVLMGTITSGLDLHEALREMALAHNIETATLEILGGLHAVTFTTYDFAQQKRLPPLLFERPLEIISGHGTISLLDGQPHIHLHMSMSFRDKEARHGIAIVGGHVAQATVFAVEVTCTAFSGTAVQRMFDPTTGLKLWHLGFPEIKSD